MSSFGYMYFVHVGHILMGFMSRKAQLYIIDKFLDYEVIRHKRKLEYIVNPVLHNGGVDFEVDYDDSEKGIYGVDIDGRKVFFFDKDDADYLIGLLVNNRVIHYGEDSTYYWEFIHSSDNVWKLER